MSQLMHLSTLITIDTAFALFMSKARSSPRDVDSFPTPTILHDLTYKLLHKVEKNFMQLELDAQQQPMYKDVPRGKGGLFNFDTMVELANYCTEHINEIQVPNKNALHYAYAATIKSRTGNTQNEKLLVDVHVIPALHEKEYLDEYPREVLQWIDDRLRFVMPACLRYLKEQGVPCAQSNAITVADWEEIVDASFDTLAEKKEQSTEAVGGEMQAFSEMTENEIAIDLMATGGDEHISLFSSDFTGTYYLPTEENVAEARKAHAVIKGYWDLFGHCKVPGDADTARQAFIDKMATAIKEFIDQRNGQSAAENMVFFD